MFEATKVTVSMTKGWCNLTHVIVTHCKVMSYKNEGRNAENIILKHSASKSTLINPAALVACRG